MYKLKFKDRQGFECEIAPAYKTKQSADARVNSIGNAQLMNGAVHVSSFPGLSRASWPDGTYIEVWRAAQLG